LEKRSPGKEIMFDQWKVLHLGEVEAESALFSRALAEEQFAGHCEAVRSLHGAKLYLERGLYTPRALTRPDIIVINWHPDCDAPVREFVHWVRRQPQLSDTPVIAYITALWSFAAQEQARQEGLTELIVRPESFEDLVWQVHALLERCVYRCVVR
jgi:hypothetical protein